MARIAYGLTLGQRLDDGRFNSSSGPIAPAVTSATVASGALTTDVAAAVAALVAEGASPTQGAVTTLNTAWGLLATAIAAATVAAGQANVVLDIDTAVVTTRNGVRSAVNELMRQVESSGLAP